jgi:UDP-N-acetylmuramate dehydrogenase
MILSRTIVRALGECGRVLENEMLKNYTSYRTGGPADILLFPYNNGCIPEILRIASDEGIPLTVIGGGSNLLIGDKGQEGIIIRLCEDTFRKADIRLVDEGKIYADSIARKDRFVDFAADAGYSGIEFMAGIPGCIGGGILMNAGTTFGAFVDILENVDVVDAHGKVRTVAVDRTMSSYRHMDIGKGVIVTGALFRLSRAEDGSQVRKRIDEILADRRKKHPLDYPSAGSVFKNPDGYSSWKLIDEAGLKGRAVGGACVSDLHTNFIINLGNATSLDIMNLVRLVQETVYKQFGVELETEIKMIGEF